MKAFRNKIRTGLGAPPLPGDADGPAAEPEDEDCVSVGSDDAELDEKPAQKILRAARNKFIERRITGTISLTRLRGIVSQSLSCEVSDDDLPEAGDDADFDDLGRMDKKMISLFGGMLNQLEKAAKAWEGHPYAHKVTIGRSSQIGFYLPIFISAGFIIEISLEASVSSLLRSRELKVRRKAFKEALKTTDPALVRGVQQQGGFSLPLAQKAVIATGGSSVEDALRWAVSQTPLEIYDIQKDFGTEMGEPTV